MKSESPVRLGLSEVCSQSSQFFLSRVSLVVGVSVRRSGRVHLRRGSRGGWGPRRREACGAWKGRRGPAGMGPPRGADLSSPCCGEASRPCTARASLHACGGRWGCAWCCDAGRRGCCFATCGHANGRPSSVHAICAMCRICRKLLWLVQAILCSQRHYGMCML